MVKKHKDIRQVVAENVSKLRVREGEKKYSLRDISEAPNVDVGSNTVKRMANPTNNPRLSTLAEVAKFFKMEPWQLLHPDFDPDKLPARVLNTAEAEFYDRLLRDVKKLRGDDPALDDGRS
jgi:transcriptional regulator with XRE-family HTH domain